MLSGTLNAIKDILRSKVVPSGTAGLMGSFVAQLQLEHGIWKKDPGGNIFEDAVVAQIDTDLQPPRSVSPPNPQAFAVVIGIEEYPNFPNVEYALRDSKKIKSYLVESMGYLEHNIVLINNQDATRSGIEVRIEEWLPTQVKGHPDAEVFVYYGGHGTYDLESNNTYLVPYDGNTAFVMGTTYSLERLYEKLGNLPVKQVTVVIDSCFSGVGGRSVIQKNAKAHLGNIKTTQVTSPNLIVFTSSDAKEISSGYMEKRHGLFTYFFLKGLQGEADSNGDGTISYKEQYKYGKAMVQTEARRNNRDQNPQVLVSQGGMDWDEHTLREQVQQSKSETRTASSFPMTH